MWARLYDFIQVWYIAWLWLHTAREARHGMRRCATHVSLLILLCLFIPNIHELTYIERFSPLVFFSCYIYLLYAQRTRPLMATGTHVHRHICFSQAITHSICVRLVVAPLCMPSTYPHIWASCSRMRKHTVFACTAESMHIFPDDSSCNMHTHASRLCIFRTCISMRCWSSQACVVTISSFLDVRAHYALCISALASCDNVAIAGELQMPITFLVD